MKKRFISLLLCLCMAIPVVGGVGCNKVKTEEGTINVMMVDSGWGTEYITDLKEKFETLYAAEGYKVNIMPARADFSGRTALSEIRMGYEKNGFDVIISSGFTVQEMTDAEYGIYAEDLTDVMNSQAINFDGSLSEKKLVELVNQNEEWHYKIDDTYYGVPYNTSSRGLVCNMKVLNRYGITAMPVTTDELFECFDIIYKGTDTVQGIRPVVWGGDNAFGYALPSFYTAIAQLMGKEKYDEFFKLNNLLTEDGKIKADGYNHVNDPAVKEAIKIVMQQFDVAYSSTGSVGQRHDVAHAMIIRGGAAFMFDGDFFFNEVKSDFSSYLKDVRFCLLPIASQLGVDLQLDGTGTDRAKCDEILSFMAKKVDEGASAADIKSATEAQFSITLTEEKVNRVIEARAIGNGGDSSLFVMAGSPNVEISKLFVRMMLSEDTATQVYSKYGMISATFTDVDVQSEYQFIKDTYAAKNVVSYNTTSSLYPYSVRANTNLFLIPPYNASFAVSFADKMGTVDSPYERDYEALSQTVFDEVVANVQSKWAEHMKGYTING